MSQPRIAAYLHIEGFDTFERSRDVFDTRQVRAGFRAAGRVVTARARANIIKANGATGYPVNRTGTLLNGINFRVMPSGFMVKVHVEKTAAMGEFYPAYLYHGVRWGSAIKKLKPGEGHGVSNRRLRGERAAALEARKASGFMIAPRKNYISDALRDSTPRVREILTAAFARALG